MLRSALAAAVKGRLLGADGGVESVSLLQNATAADLAAILYSQDFRLAKTSHAGCILTSIEEAAEHGHHWNTPSILAVEDPFEAFRQILALFANCLVSRNAVIAASSKIHPTAVIADNVSIGENCEIGPLVSIGEDGFVLGAHLKGVRIADNVKIGANCVIARGLLRDTQIGQGTRIDSLVQIAHDVVIGENVIIAAQAGIAGFVNIGDNVTLGGQCGIAPHVTIGNGARISGQAGVHRDVPVNAVYSGSPAIPHMDYLRSSARWKNYDKH